MMAKPLRPKTAARAFGATLVALSTILYPALTQAAFCPWLAPPSIPFADSSNIDKHKQQLVAYHDNNYDQDIAAVMAAATQFLEARVAENAMAPQPQRLAVVLDIDETSISNWDNIKTNNFGFIPNGPCSGRAGFACGFNDWINKAAATPIRPTLQFFNVARSKNVAIFFITGRRHSQRAATIKNLTRAGFKGWAELRTRPDNEHTPSIVPFKSGERARLAASGNYTIIATIGDQDSDLEGGSAECGIKLPNPFYFIK
jgi:predicted secreted acid phosphatase